MNVNVDEKFRSNRVFIVWGPIFGGFIVGLCVSILLNILGVGLGIFSISNGAEFLKEVSIGAIAWIFLVGFIQMFFAGVITGFFTIYMKPIARIYHSVVTWGFSIVITAVLFATTTGAIIGGANGLMAQIATLNIKSSSQSQLQIDKYAQNLLPKLNSLDKQTSSSTKDEISDKAAEWGQKSGWILILATIASIASLFLAILGSLLGSGYFKVGNNARKKT